MADDKINRATGLLIIDVVSSNPNGDPDRDGDPRQRPDGIGEISPVSFKRKIRDLVEEKEGPVWKEMESRLKLTKDYFDILESRGRDRDKIVAMIKKDIEQFKRKYWDARVFGNTFLEKEKKEGGTEEKKTKENKKVDLALRNSIKSGVVHFGLGLSAAPVRIKRDTFTNKAGVQEGKNQGMAPMAYRIVQHGLYYMPFFVNPSAVHKTGCEKKDVHLLLATIPYAYAHTPSLIRNRVEIVHAWYMEHKSPLGSCSDFALISALTPKKNSDPNIPSNSRDEYAIPSELPQHLRERLASFEDLMADIHG